MKSYTQTEHMLDKLDGICCILTRSKSGVSNDFGFGGYIFYSCRRKDNER
jgi:hypothetical protein